MPRSNYNYEDSRPRKKRRRRKGILHWLIGKLIRLLMIAIIFCVIIAVGLYFLPTSLMHSTSKSDLNINSSLPSEPMNILILGVDAFTDSMQRSDTMIIASIDKDTIKLTSVERDIIVDIEGHGQNKLNAVYAFNGPEATMKKINELFSMNITRYVVVDFTVLVKMVDAIGGVRIDITEDEMYHINKNVLLSAPIFAPLGYRETELKKYGEGILLDGLRALAYARIRKLDSDFVRMRRQRVVINAMLKKLRKTLLNPISDIRFLQAGLSGIQTNLSVPELISIGEKALLCKGFSDMRLPIDGTFQNGNKIEITDFNTNINAVHSFIYS